MHGKKGSDPASTLSNVSPNNRPPILLVHHQPKKRLPRRALRPGRNTRRDLDTSHLPLRPDMTDDLQLITAVQRARSNDDTSGPRGVGVVDPGHAGGTGMLPRDAIGSRCRELEELRAARHAELVLRQQGIEAEGTARPGLAVKAMTGIGARQLRRRKPIADSPAATATFDHVTAFPAVPESEWNSKWEARPHLSPSDA